jgi:hypothetical protein
MVGIPDILVNIGANIAPLNSSLRAAGAAVSAFAATVGAFAIQSARAAVEMQDLANAAGASLSEFQRAAAGARSLGIENAKLSDIFRDTNDKIGDFMATGGGELKDFFEKIAPKVGVTADQFAKLSGPQALQLYVSSLEKAGASQKEMVFYLEAIASDSSLLIPLLQNGGKAFAEIGEQAAKYGLITDSTVASGRELRASTAQLGTAFTALGVALVDTGIVEAMSAFVRATADFIGLTIAPALTAMAESMQPVIDNLDRVAVYAGAAAGVLLLSYIPALVVAAGSMIAAAAAAVTLRGAIMATGIGAVIVIAGELAIQMMRLVKGAGSFGAALGILADVASEVWGRIKAGGSTLIDVLGLAFVKVEIAFMKMLESIQAKWSIFLSDLAARVSSVPGLGSLGDSLAESAMSAGEGVIGLGATISAFEARAVRMGEAVAASVDAATAPLESLIALREAMAAADAADAAAAALPGATVPELPGMGGAGAGGVGGAGMGAETPEQIAERMAMRLEALRAGWQTESEATAEWYAQGQQTLAEALATEFLTTADHKAALQRLEQEHASRVASIEERKNQQTQRSQDAAYASVKGGLMALFGETKAVRVAMAIADTFAGANRALSEHPAPYSYAIAAGIIATGFANVKSIMSARPGGGGASAGGGAGAAAGAAAAAKEPDRTQTFSFNIQNDSMGFGESFARQMVEQLNNAQRNGGTIRGVIA